MNTSKIKPGLPVHGKSESQMGNVQGAFVGCVDHLDGEDFIKLKKSDSKDGQHHWIPVSWVERVDERGIYLSKTPEEFERGMLDSLPPQAKSA